MTRRNISSEISLMRPRISGEFAGEELAMKRWKLDGVWRRFPEVI